MPYKKELLAAYQCNDLIRVGRKKDGGYIISKRIIDVSDFLFSGGIYTDWSFEKEFIKKSNLKKYFLIDKDTAINSQLKNLLINLKNKKINLTYKLKSVFHVLYNIPRIFIFRRINKNNFIEAYLTSSNLEKSQEEKMTTLPSLIKRLNIKLKKHTIFLKLDIEGSEWEILSDIFAISRYLSGIALEVHSLDINGDKLNELITRLNNLGLYLIHVHPNNAGGFCRGTRLPRLLELSFLSSELFSEEEINAQKKRPFFYLNKLDKPCDPRQPEFLLDNYS